MTPIPTEQQPIVPFVLSLLAGLWMLAMGGMVSGMGTMHGVGFMNDAGSWMWGEGMMAPALYRRIGTCHPILAIA
jgi:hypothetical protein